MTVYGVDIHARYQAGINFAKLKQEGYGFAVMKFTEGTGVSFLNSAKTWIPQMRAAGLVPGGYHWIKAGDGAAQARFFWQHVQAVGGPKGMLIQLDCEDNATQSDVTEWVNEWKRLSGGHPFLIYSGGWWWKPRGWTGTKWTPYLWQSHYLSADPDTISDDPAAFAARVPASWWNPGYGGWTTATILQFTSKGDAGSLGNNVDLNVYRGTMADLKRLAGIEEDDMTTIAEIKNLLMTDQQLRNSLAVLPWTADIIPRGVPADDPNPTMTTGFTLGFILTVIGRLTPRLDEILAAAQDDDNTNVVLDPASLTALQELRDSIAGVPAAVAQEQAKRLTE